MPKSFERVAAVPRKKKRTNLAVVDSSSDNIINLNQVDLNDRENWLRALDICKAQENQCLENILSEIEQYQGQIDQALRTAQAQSTIYAYAIGTRLDVIEEQELYKQQGYDNLTKLIQSGTIKRPSGETIATRQVWAYRRVTRGLNEFLQVAEAIREGQELTPEVYEYLEELGKQLNRDVIESFLHSYAETITGVLELGVSKLDQVCRLPSPIAVSGLLAGKIQLENDIVEVGEVSFSTLRKAISNHENKQSKLIHKNTNLNPDVFLSQIEVAIEGLKSCELKGQQRRKLRTLLKKMDALRKD